MSIRIITDSTCDISQNDGAKIGIDIIPLKVIFGENQYADGIDLTSDEFFQKLSEAKTLPTTSQVSPDEFLTVFKKYSEMGDEIICITLAAGISGTYQSAVIAKDLLGYEKIHIIDSTQATFSLTFLVLEAIKMRDNGSSAEEICNKINELKQKIVFLAAVDTLKYLKMGGRISGTAATIGGLLNIKPIVTLKDGVITAIGKARGQHAAFEYMNNSTKTIPMDTNYPIFIAHSNAEDYFEKFIEFLDENGFDTENAIKVTLGSVIGTHAGPGCIGFGYIAK